MINLLPQKEKEILSLKATNNLVIILGVIVIISVICMILASLAVKFSILNQEVPQKFLLEEAERKYQSPEIISLKETIQKYNKEMPKVLSFYESGLYFGDALYKISVIKKSEGLHFNDISLDGKTYVDRIKVAITGVSDSRDDLLAFQKEIEQYKEIKNIYFSPNSWINPTKSNFNLTFEFYENGN